MFPEVDLRADQIYVQSDRIWTSAGVAAGFDCALEFISQTFGAASADAIARNLVLPSHRTAVRRQVIEAPVAARSKDRRLNALLDEIRADLGKARSIDTVAAELGMSRRTFTRRFRDHVGMAFGDWLLEERVKAARIVLEASNEPIDALSSRLGFSSPAAFRDQFERRFGRMPADWRHAHRLSPMELF
jgi:transcriptional regulator GlxA family with amidase domain